MTKPEAANTIEIESFAGLQTNVDPRNADDGGSLLQENLSMVVPGMLQVRGGIREISFEEQTMGNLHQTGVWNSGLFSSELFDGYAEMGTLNGDPFMSFVDYVDINGTLVFPILTDDVGGEAVAADAPPTYDILSADQTSVLVNDAATTALSGRTGVYKVSQSITAALGFAAGNTYTLIADWEINSSARHKAYTFKVTQVYLGKFAVGDRIPLTVITVDGDTIATAADSVPKVYFYTPAGTNVAVVNVPKVDYVNHRHMESYRVPSSLTTQKHILVYEWAVSNTYHTADSCEIISGGDAAGNVFSLKTVNRPGGQWVVYATENGNIKAGFEPY